MNQEEQFMQWMLSQGKKESTIKKYARQSHKWILGNLKQDFYGIENIEKLHELLITVRRVEDTLEKNPNRMYSSALVSYIIYKSEKINDQEAKTDGEYEYLVQNSIERLTHLSTEAEIESLIKTTYENSHFPRNPTVGALAINKANYLCRINSKHKFFISEKTHQNYVEAHHLVPFAYQGLFNRNLDRVENISSLCPACHRGIHYGENSFKKSLVNQLYDYSKSELVNSGIEISKKSMLELYRIY